MRERFDGWKEISKYLGKDVRTAQHWEKKRALPVYRTPGSQKGSVFAFQDELDQWLHPKKHPELNQISTSVGLVDRHVLYSYPQGNVDAIRLWGTGDAYVSSDHLFVEYEHKPYSVPQIFRNEGEQRIKRMEKEADRRNKLFWDGPCVRLLHWHHNQQGPDEEHRLSLRLGAVSWYDFERTNGLIHEKQEQQSEFTEHVALPKMYEGNLEDGCRLSNILSNAITVFTRDGKVGYQIRGARPSIIPGAITSSIDENINRSLDVVRPKGIPHPLEAVRRGIAQEGSPKLSEHIGTFALKVTGLAFGLDLLHPELLWLAAVDVTSKTFTQWRHERPGAEVDEGVIEFVPASFHDRRTQPILARTDWHPAGKASIVRAIEFIEAFRPNVRPETAFDLIAQAQ